MKRFSSAYLVSREALNKENISTYTKITQYKAMVRNAGLYKAKIITLGRHRAKQLEKEKKILDTRTQKRR